MIKKWDDFILINDYILLKKIASGGMAKVYLARKKGAHGFEKFYAVKQIHENLLENESFFRMFLYEAKLSAKLEHPNIIKIFDLVEEDNNFLMVMEYIKGKNLRTVLRKVAMNKKHMYPIALKIISDVLKGLYYAHNFRDINGKKLNIIHRDISPQNIMISYEGEVKITDFGIAKAADSFEETRTGVLKGKLSYMSPEQAMGRKADFRSDLYAVGIMLYEMLTLRKCFSGSEMELMRKVQRGEFIPIEKILPKLDKRLIRIVNKALAYNPNERFQSALEFQNAIDNYIYEMRFPQEKLNISLFMHRYFADEIKKESEELARLNRKILEIPYFGTETTTKSAKKEKKHPKKERKKYKTTKKINIFKPILNIFLILFIILLLFDLLFVGYYRDFVNGFPFSKKVKEILTYRPEFIPDINLIPYYSYEKPKVIAPQKPIKFIFIPKPEDLIVKDTIYNTPYKMVKEMTGTYSIKILSHKQYQLTFEKKGYVPVFKTIKLSNTNSLPFPTIALKEKQSKINIITDPKDSLIYDNGKLVADSSPFTIVYNPISDTSVHIIDVKHEGYIPFRKTVVFSGDSTTLTVKLPVKKVVVTFKIIPWGMVYENNRLIGTINKGGEIKREFVAGKHTFKFVYPDTDKTKVLTYNLTDNRTIIYSFSDIFGKVFVTSYPPGADIYVDDVILGQTPKLLILKKGYHKIVVYMNNYNSCEKDVTVEEGKEITVHCDLSPINE